MRHIFALLVLTACTDNPDLGKLYTKKKWVCLKSESNLATGISMSGNVVIGSTSNCVVTKCFLVQYSVGNWIDKEIKKDINPRRRMHIERHPPMNNEEFYQIRLKALEALGFREEQGYPKGSPLGDWIAAEEKLLDTIDELKVEIHRLKKSQIHADKYIEKLEGQVKELRRENDIYKEALTKIKAPRRGDDRSSEWTIIARKEDIAIAEKALKDCEGEK